MQFSLVFAILVFAHVSSAWVRFREPQSRRNFLNQTLIEKLQNCAGKETQQCGLCGEGPGEIQTNVIPTENYTVVDPDVRVLAVELGFRAGLNGHLEFRICNVTNDSMADGIACNETTPLLIGSDVKWYPSQTQSSAKSRFRLPRGLVCERCVLQVKYTPGPKSKMKDFRFFDCALLNITHPTKVSTNSVTISREEMPKDVFPPDHAVLDGSHISAEIRSSGNTAGEGSDFIRSVNRTFTFKSVSNRLTVDENRIDSNKHGGSTISVRRIPSRERTSSFNLKQTQPTKNDVVNPEVTNVLSNGTVNDRRVVITTKLFNMTNSNSNVGDSKDQNRARITMIEIVPNNKDAASNNRVVESKLNRTEVVRNVMAQPSQVDTRVGMFNVSRNGFQNRLSNSVNVPMVNKTTFNRSPEETAIFENTKTNGLVENANNRNLAAKTETVVGQKRQNSTVDWKIYNNEPIIYDEYYFYNDTGTNNDTYYYEDFTSDTNATFVSNLADTVAVNSNASNQGLLIKSTNRNSVNATITGQAMFSTEHQGVNEEIHNRNVSSSATVIKNKTRLDDIKALREDLQLQRNSTNINTNSESFVHRQSNANVNSGLVDSIKDTRTVWWSNTANVGESEVESLDKNLRLTADKSKDRDQVVSDTKTDTVAVIYSGVFGDRDILRMKSRPVIQSNHMAKGLDADSGVKITSKEKSQIIKAHAGTALTNETVDRIVINNEGGSSSHMYKTSGSGLQHSISTQTPDIFDKTSLINETVRLMAVLTERPAANLSSVDTVGEAFKRGINSSVNYTEIDIQTNKINQQVVDVPHTIIVLPKYKTVPHLGQVSDTQSFGFMSEQKKQENQTLRQDAISRNETYTYQEDFSSLDLYNETRNYNTLDNIFQTAVKDIVTPSSRNVTVAANGTTTKTTTTIITHPNKVADVTTGRISDFSNDAHERTHENASRSAANETSTLEEITSYNHDAMFLPTSPVYQFTKRVSYSISAADRRPNYANMEVVRSVVKESSRNGNTSVQSFDNKLNNVVLNTEDSSKTKQSSEDIQGNSQITREYVLSSGTKVVISRNATSESMKALNNDTAWKRAKTLGSQSSQIDINNRLIEGVSSTEPAVSFETNYLQHFQESVTNADIPTQARDSNTDINSSKVTQATTKDNSGFLDISTRAYDTYIGLVTTTVEPLSHSSFVRVVNYSTVEADSIFPPPQRDVGPLSDVASSAQSQTNTESFLMSIFSSTPSPTATTSVLEKASIPVKANIPIVAQETFLSENSDMFENVNFLTDSEANVDHLGGVPIHSISDRTGGGELDFVLSVPKNDRNRNIVSDQFISSSNFDISNRLDDRKDRKVEGNSNEVIWKAAERGSAIPVGMLTINTNVQTHNDGNASIERGFVEQNQSQLTRNMFLINVNQSTSSNINVDNNNEIVKNATIEKAIVWQSMPLANFSKSDKVNIKINEWHSKPVDIVHRINTKEGSSLHSIPIDSLSKSDKMVTDVGTVRSTVVEKLQTSVLKETNADMMQLKPLNDSNRSGKTGTNINVYMPSGKDSKRNRNLDIFINGNAIINKVTSTKNKDAVRVITGIMNTPEVMPPIEVNNPISPVTYKTRNVIDSENKVPQAPLLQTTKTNIKLFTPYLKRTDATSKNNRWRLQNDLLSFSSEQMQNLDFVSEAVSKSSDEHVDKNLSVSAIWDINRRNTDSDINRWITNEEILTEQIPVPSESSSDMPYTVLRQDSSITDTNQNIEQLVNTSKVSKDAIAVEHQIQSDVNKQVLRTLEALVLELEAMKMKGGESRRPVVESSLYSQTIDRSIHPNIIHSSYPVFSVHPDLLTLPSEFVNDESFQRNSRGLRGSENHKLLNVLGISNQRDWKSNITLNSSIGTENINNTISRKGSNQQIVNLSAVRSKATDEFSTLLNTFADVSSTRSQQEMNPGVVKLMDYTEQFSQMPDASRDNLSMTENSGVQTDKTQVAENRITLPEAKQQTVITADSSTFINPFTGERMPLSTNGKQFADKFIVRGTGNLKHLKGVDGLLFNPNFTTWRYNYIPKERLNNIVSIQGKYLYGEMRRNEMGQFEPVPIASKLELSLTDKKPQTTIIKLTKDETDNVSTVNKNNSLYTGLPGNAFVNTERATKDKTATKMHKTFLSNVTTEALSKLIESSKNQLNGTGKEFLIKTSEQEVVSKGPDHSSSGKVFYNQEDLLRTNRIALNQTVPLTKRLIATRNITSDFKADSISCKENEMFVCKAVGKNRFIPGMVWWCFSHCRSGVCPPEKCSCRCENVRETSNIKRVDNDSTSGPKRRKKVIQLTLNTQSNGSARVSEEQSSNSKSETMLRNIVRPKVLNATVSSFNKTNIFTKENEAIRTVQLFDTPTVKCKGINAFANTTGIDELCTKICSQNMCPEAICMCYE